MKWEDTDASHVFDILSLLEEVRVLNFQSSRAGSAWRPPTDQCLPIGAGVQSMATEGWEMGQGEW